MSTAIEFNNVGKQYRLGLVSTKTLSHDLNRWWQMNILKKEDPYLKIGETNDRSSKGNSDYVWALRDIDFKVEQGDVVGIIGKNGAGKSTLLKLLSRVTNPTTGTIRARGRIASLLEVGTGFHPEMTGRENIFMNGAILGMTKHEIRSKLEEIVDFSGCERYIDTPVKRYSSGMMVRLGFAVAAHLDPEILVVDEVLAVGDAEFQKKAIGKMQEVSQGQGRTVLFVSHNMESIKKLCNTGVLLRNGMIDYTGDISSVVSRYQQIFVYNRGAEWNNTNNITHDSIHINSFKLLNNNHVVSSSLQDNDELYVEIDFNLNTISKDLTFGVQLYDKTGVSIYRTLDVDCDQYFNDKLKLGNNIIKAKLPIDFLSSGEYNVILDASYHNRGWLINPNVETELVLSFTKNQAASFSPLHSSASIVSPVIKWELKN